eukprot:gb/GECH01007218.1/.p1 GENE.gb/GECH01007218.1/~~gb/GECH01007218.1/.p1  ORF type:complete len:235 (+),score=68.71 gb/GECH01007218.1/:1-705(+)
MSEENSTGRNWRLSEKEFSDAIGIDYIRASVVKGCIFPFYKLNVCQRVMEQRSRQGEKVNQEMCAQEMDSLQNCMTDIYGEVLEDLSDVSRTIIPLVAEDAVGSCISEMRSFDKIIQKGSEHVEEAKEKAKSLSKCLDNRLLKMVPPEEFCHREMTTFADCAMGSNYQEKDIEEEQRKLPSQQKEAADRCSDDWETLKSCYKAYTQSPIVNTNAPQKFKSTTSNRSKENYKNEW